MIEEIKEAIRVLDTIPFERSVSARAGLLSILQQEAESMRVQAKKLEEWAKSSVKAKDRNMNYSYAIAMKSEAAEITDWCKKYE